MLAAIAIIFFGIAVLFALWTIRDHQYSILKETKRQTQLQDEQTKYLLALLAKEED
ncbi:hypothetical protein JCM19232_4732 [Vibrio ishigakensis]|uniref:Uncharacterized protein n=1 Tax=Vibrio ishigakensis TaxID=1481914 RepID=A0A0B8P874_9VIBR|nr:hypothetical protein JCM19232_4732 [Vibrio ishigakensis]